MARIAVAVSGGADSLYALISLQEAGHEVFALHGLFLPHILHEPCPSTVSAPLEDCADGVAGLTLVCKERDIPLHIIDFRAQFDAAVITPFIQEYASGRTPNPCALCNKQIKFGLLMDAALQLGAERFATGHYATLTKAHTNEEALHVSPLAKGNDTRKDQSYFLSLVPKERFATVLFPLATTQKTRNIAYLQERNVSIPIAKESQEICFVPADAYREFVQQEAHKRRIRLGKRGSIFVREDGQDVLLPKKYGGEHLGLWQYTEGQRRGLGVAWKEPLYVCTKDCTRNALVLGNKDEAKLLGCKASHVNFLVPFTLWPQEVFVRVRYRQQEALAKILFENEQLHITFEQAQAPTAPGQIAAIYDAQGHILAGGIIESVL